MFYDRGDHFEFTSVAKELAPAGTIEQEETEYPFDFTDIEKQYESYNGINVRLRYSRMPTTICHGCGSMLRGEIFCFS